MEGPQVHPRARNTAQVVEMSSIGGYFTWTNKQPGPNFTQYKLNRALINQVWIDKWPEARLEFHVGYIDLKAMVINNSQDEKGSKPFRLYNTWL